MERAVFVNKAQRYFQENAPVPGLGRASVHSGVMMMAAKLIGVVYQLTSIIVLGRLLSPHDFGITATIFALIAFGPMLVDFGTSESTSQKAHITEVEVSSLFWFNTAIGLALTIIFAACGGLIAKIYNEPALREISVVSSLTFIASALPIQHTALLRRAMQFRRLALIDIVSNAVSATVGITMAYYGWGYWSLVIKLVLQYFLVVIGAWISCPWVPGRPQLTPETKSSVRFGFGVTGFTMTDWLAQSFDRIALGYFFGFGALGYYQNAFNFYSNLMNLVAGSLHNIAVSSLSKLRSNLNDFRTSWARALSTVSFFSSLAFALVAVSGQDLIVILLGQKWAESGLLLSIFAVRGIAQISERTIGWLHVPLGRSDRWMRWGFVSAICQILAVSAGLPWGPIGVAVACAITMYLLFVPALTYAGQPALIGARDVLAAAGPPTAAGLVAVAIGILARNYLLADVPALVRLFASSLICLSVYITLTVVIFKIIQPLQLALSVVRDFIPARLLRNS